MQCPWLSCVAWGLRRRTVRPPAAATCSVIWLLLWGQRACPNHGLISTPVKRVPDASVPKIVGQSPSFYLSQASSSGNPVLSLPDLPHECIASGLMEFSGTAGCVDTALGPTLLLEGLFHCGFQPVCISKSLLSFQVFKRTSEKSAQ